MSNITVVPLSMVFHLQSVFFSLGCGMEGDHIYKTTLVKINTASRLCHLGV